MYLVKGLWSKFGLNLDRNEDFKLLVEAYKQSDFQQEPILDETGTETKGETPVGSEENIKEIKELFKKHGVEKIIEQVKADKISREDFKEFLFDDARKGDNFITDEEKAKINAIMTKLGMSKEEIALMESGGVEPEVEEPMRDVQ